MKPNMHACCPCPLFIGFHRIVELDLKGVVVEPSFSQVAAEIPTDPAASASAAAVADPAATAAVKTIQRLGEGVVRVYDEGFDPLLKKVMFGSSQYQVQRYQVAGTFSAPNNASLQVA